MFMRFTMTTILSIKNERERWMNLDFFLENKTSCVIFVGSGLKDIFHCCTHLLIFSRSLIRFAVVSLTCSTTENKDVVS